MEKYEYKVDFQQLKSQVGVDDIAYALGYRLDRKAGVGKYIELVLGDGKSVRDVIVVSNPRDKGSQRYFRRDGSKGDVVTLIRENLNAFGVTGSTEWQKVANVLADFANLPQPDFHEDREYVKKSSLNTSKDFDASRYQVRKIDSSHIPSIFAHRGITDSTVNDFGNYIVLIRDTKNTKFQGDNIGFPYSNLKEHTSVTGYEIRGYNGYKSKAAGTDSSTSSWVAQFHFGKPDDNPQMVRNVFFFESAFDAMAFYQTNKVRLSDHFALVSIGGTFSDGQIKSVMNRFPNSKYWDCFDNDIAGRIYGIRLLALTSGIHLNIINNKGILTVESSRNSISFNKFDSLAEDVSNFFNIKSQMHVWSPPGNFKDWNDLIMNKPMEIHIGPNKFDRDDNLAEARKTKLKLKI